MNLGAITLRQLRALLAVAEHRSLTAAADVMNQTTPAIHSQIRNLEDAVGQPLLVRGGAAAGYGLTPAGNVIARAARRISADLSQAEAEITSLTRGYMGHVRLAVVSTGQYFAPRLVRMLRDAAPEVEISLRVGNRKEVMADLEQGAADLAIMGRPPRRPLVTAEPLGPHPHGIVLPRGHHLAGKDGFDPSALMEETFIVREQGSGTRSLMMRYFDRLGEGMEPRMITMDSNEIIKQAVIEGLGIAFLSLHTCRDELESGRLVALRGTGLPVVRQWYLVRPAEAEATAAVVNITEQLMRLAGSYFPKLDRNVVAER